MMGHSVGLDSCPPPTPCPSPPSPLPVTGKPESVLPVVLITWESAGSRQKSKSFFDEALMRDPGLDMPFSGLWSSSGHMMHSTAGFFTHLSLPSRCGEFSEDKTLLDLIYQALDPRTRVLLPSAGLAPSAASPCSQALLKHKHHAITFLP